MTNIHCTHCNRPLSGGLDTFGSVGGERCFDCYFEEEPGVDLLELELLETIRLARIELDALLDRDWANDITPDERDDCEYERAFYEAELVGAYATLEEHRRRVDERVDRWRESVGAA